MANFHNSGLYFESVSTDTKKHFKVSFPYDIYFSLKWDEDELEALQAYEKSDNISDKLLMLALIASKIEARTPLQKERVTDGTEKA